MPISRWCAVLLCLCPVAPAAAQSGTPAPQQLPKGNAPQAQSNEPDIVVSGETGEKKSDWKRAEADHVVVFSDGSEVELVRVTNNLERLYQLMSRLYRRGASSDDTAKLQVTLFNSAVFLDKMGLQNLRWDEGPYAAGIGAQRYYDPREDGEVLAVSRSDQVIKLNTKKGYDRDCDDIAAEGDGRCNNVPNRPPVMRSWEAVLYSAFAQHFILTYTQRVYPRWYVDGIGALFSTMDVRRDGSIDYAREPMAYKQVFRSYGDLDVGEVLTGRYLEPEPGKTRRMDWTPYHAWLLAHFFSYSNLKPERAAQFRQYMTAIHQGAPMAEAAKAFGDMRKLQHEISLYAGRPISYARTDQQQAAVANPLVTSLSLSSAAVIATRIELGARLTALPVKAGVGAVDATEAQARADWLAKVRDKVAQLPFDADALLVVAEADCRAGQSAACLATAERVLATAPDNVRALAWKGAAQTDEAVAGPVADRAAGLAAARKTIGRAMQLDSQAPLPLIAYFQSFTKAGERVPEQAMLGMARVVQYVPAAPGPRLYLGEELVRQGNTDLARRILYPVLYGVDDSPEKRAAMALFAPAGGARARGY
jgi:hypothetical protein